MALLQNTETDELVAVKTAKRLSGKQMAEALFKSVARRLFEDCGKVLAWTHEPIDYT